MRTALSILDSAGEKGRPGRASRGTTARHQPSEPLCRASGPVGIRATCQGAPPVTLVVAAKVGCRGAP